MTAPVLTDDVVVLRAHHLGDVDDMVVMGSDPQTARWTTTPQPYERRHAVDWVSTVTPTGWRDGTACGWAITVDDRFAGNLDIRLGPPPDIGYTLAPWARGRGVMARAVRLATRWAFDVRGLPIVHWSAHAGNFASWRVAHACGFTFHGERPLALSHRGELLDLWEGSLRPGDPQQPRTPWWPTPVLDVTGLRLRPHHDQRSDRLLGHVSLFRLSDKIDPTGGEIGYWAHPDARGRGVTTAAVRRVVEFAFTPVADGGLGRNRLQIGAAWGNTASRHVAEKAGFTLVGHLHQDGVLGDGTYDDGALYELIRRRPRAGSPSSA